jgi:type IV secretion system protein VirD4
MRTIKAIAAGLAVLLLGALASIGYLAWSCGTVAWFRTHTWIVQCMARNPDRQMHALLIFLAFALVAGLVANFCRRDAQARKVFGASRWATLEDVIAAGLVMMPGQRSRTIRVLGKFADRIITYTGDAHTLVCGGNRSGKGRGIAVPTALSLACSVVFHDSKGEFMFGDPKHGFPGTSGFRARLGHKVIYFNPKDRRSARYNPLLMVRKGDHEVADMQRLILTLMGRAPKDFWEKGGGRMMLAIGLHILRWTPLVRLRC